MERKVVSTVRLLLVASLCASRLFGQTDPLRNSGFESWSSGRPADWIVAGVSRVARETNERVEGGSSVRLEPAATSSEVSVSQDAAVSVPGSYSFSCMVLDTTANGQAGLTLSWYAGETYLGYESSARSADGPSWQSLSIQNRMAPAGATVARVKIRAYKQDGRSGGYVFADRASFEGDGRLPVGLGSFEARFADGGVEVKWVTESETETLGFRLYRGPSASGPFEPVTAAVIPARGGGSERTEYSFLDRNPGTWAETWYRLEETDTRGNPHVLGLARVSRDSDPESPETAPAASGVLSNFPNPFNPGTTVQFGPPEAAAESEPAPVSGVVRLVVLDACGREVAALDPVGARDGSGRASWNGKDRAGRDAPSGLYLVLLEREGCMPVFGRMVKAR
jgi:hypothetical protein